MSEKIDVIDIGDSVACDMCNADFTESDEEGGIVFGSNAVCPSCHERIKSDIEKYNESQYIQATCPDGVSFRDFILAYRRQRYGDKADKIIVHTFE